jgi:hypothetical protein
MAGDRAEVLCGNGDAHEGVLDSGVASGALSLCQASGYAALPPAPQALCQSSMAALAMGMG